MDVVELRLCLGAELAGALLRAAMLPGDGEVHGPSFAGRVGFMQDPREYTCV